MHFFFNQAWSSIFYRWNSSGAYSRESLREDIFLDFINRTNPEDIWNVQWQSVIPDSLYSLRSTWNCETCAGRASGELSWKEFRAWSGGSIFFVSTLICFLCTFTNMRKRLSDAGCGSLQLPHNSLWPTTSNGTGAFPGMGENFQILAPWRDIAHHHGNLPEKARKSSH